MMHTNAQMAEFISQASRGSSCVFQGPVRADVDSRSQGDDRVSMMAMMIDGSDDGTLVLDNSLM